jgi:hypothetical protein
MDHNGDAEGNYTLLARKPHRIFPQQYGLYPVGVFSLKQNDNRLLVSLHSTLSVTILWAVRTSFVHAGFLLGRFCTLKMEVIRSSESSVHI